MRRVASTVVVIALVLIPLFVSAAAFNRRRAVRHPSSDVPIARADAFTVARGGTLVRDAATGVLANDADPKSRPLTAVLISTTTNGTLTLNGDGSFTYVQTSATATADAFTYKAVAGVVESSPATATITITDAPPLAVNDAFSGITPSFSVAAPGVLGNDTRNNAAIASYGVNGTEQATPGNATPTAQGGNVRLNADGGFTFEAAGGFTGTDAFKYTLANGGGTATAQVNVSVLPPPPTAANDSYSTQQNTPLTIAAPGVLANDTTNGATISSYGASSGTEQQSLGAATSTTGGGSVMMNANGGFTYSPTASFTGNDTFKYIVTSASGNATATVTITVQASDTIDFVVNSPGFFFTFSGVSGNNPILTLTRGRTYRFRIQTSPIHPFEILGAPPGSVTNNNISNGILTFAVPAAAQNYEYWCPIHAFGNQIQTVP
jgi:hypothetical protein